jgi:hypothetical protein
MTANVPAVETSDARMAAVRLELETNVVVRFPPFH